MMEDEYSSAAAHAAEGMRLNDDVSLSFTVDDVPSNSIGSGGGKHQRDASPLGGKMTAPLSTTSAELKELFCHWLCTGMETLEESLEEEDIPGFKGPAMTQDDATSAFYMTSLWQLGYPSSTLLRSIEQRMDVPCHTWYHFTFILALISGNSGMKAALRGSTLCPSLTASILRFTAEHRSEPTEEMQCLELLTRMLLYLELESYHKPPASIQHCTMMCMTWVTKRLHSLEENLFDEPLFLGLYIRLLRFLLRSPLILPLPERKRIVTSLTAACAATLKSKPSMKGA